MLTKLRPFVHNFLKEASSFFEMYVYTMAERSYAMEIVKLLDPGKVYFDSKVITQADCTQRHQKGLDVVLGAESIVVILDDTEAVSLVLIQVFNILFCQTHMFLSQSFAWSCGLMMSFKPFRTFCALSA